MDRARIDRVVARQRRQDGVFELRDRAVQACNYNDQMPVVRYAALAALVFWLGGMTQALGAGAFSLTRAGLACGAVILTALFVMKFVGPPPHGFVPRAAIVVAMMVLTAVPFVVGESRTLIAVTLALGFVLLSWYARE